QHARPQRGGWRHGLGDGQQRAGLAERRDLGSALGALGQVLLELGSLDGVESVDGIGTRKRMDLAHACATSPTPNASLSRISPSLIRAFAVPIGRSSMLATSVCVYLPRNASSTASRCLAVRSARAARTRVASIEAAAASAVSSCGTDLSRCPYAASRRPAD